MHKDGIREKARADLRRYFARLTEEETARGVLTHERALIDRLS